MWSSLWRSGALLRSRNLGCSPQIGASHQLSSVSSYVVDLKKVKKSGSSVIQGVVQENQPITEPKDPRGASLRRSYERPTTTCSSQRYLPPPSADGQGRVKVGDH